jgi:hypothetical protein
MASSLNKPVDHMFRAGQISPRSMARLKAQHGWSPGKGAKTKGEMAPFSGKGTKDQGGVRDRGYLRTNHQDDPTHQTMGVPARGAGVPSKGGRVHGKQPRIVLDEDQIDDGRYQEPKFPAGARTSGRGGAPPRLSAQTGRIPKMGGYYGGGGQDTQ